MKDSDKCTHCHLCRQHCAFLKKYEMDIGDTERLKELAYHCFLCGECSRVCPEKIDGRSMVLNMRRSEVEENNGRCPEKGYTMILAEKKNYLFRNKRHTEGKSILFPGCNFPSFYPGTTRKIIQILQKEADMGVLFDCCGKPVEELGLHAQAKQSIGHINDSLAAAGAEEVVMLCPNCYYFLKDKLKVRVTSIYEKLSQLGIGWQIEGIIHYFPPCPDREQRQWVTWVRPFLMEEPVALQGVQCCGLGGCAGIKEPDLSMDMARRITGQENGRVYTYCASCAGNLTRSGCQNVTHFLTEILQCGEQPDIRRSVINRMRTKFW